MAVHMISENFMNDSEMIIIYNIIKGKNLVFI